MFKNLSRRLALVALGLACVTLAGTGVEAGSQKKVRVLIIDGQNNHNWKATTPVMKHALEACGRFTVHVATSPSRGQAPKDPEPTKPNEPKKPKDTDPAKIKQYDAAMKNYEKAFKKYQDEKKAFEANKDDLLTKYAAAKKVYQTQQLAYKEGMEKFHPDLGKYDVVLSNYNGDTWCKELQDDLEHRLKEGKIGLVIVHAANNSFGNWVEYNLMIGMGWRGATFGKRLKVNDDGKTIIVPPGKDGGSNHSYSGPFEITVRDTSHPITKGMPAEWMHYNDELYDNMRGPIEHVHLLATAHAPKGKGTGVHEPMIWTVSYGKGKVFHTPMGHDAGSMSCVGFLTTLERGTEWAATGEVTIPIPSNFPTATKTSTIKK